MTHWVQSDGTAPANTYVEDMGTPRPFGGGCSSYVLLSGTHQPTHTSVRTAKRIEATEFSGNERRSTGELLASTSASVEPINSGLTVWGGGGSKLNAKTE